MRLSFASAAFLVLLAPFKGSESMSSRCGDTSKCLKVFDHTPASLPKCYCTELCTDRLSRVAATCASNQLHADDCGACLRCARALGQTCGGSHNVVGVCAGGLVCKVRVPSDSLDRRRAEQQAIGTCVREDDDECARSTDSEETLQAKGLVSCRPGLLGILADALYCPEISSSGRDQCGTRQTATAAAAAGGRQEVGDEVVLTFGEDDPPLRIVADLQVNNITVLQGGNKRKKRPTAVATAGSAGSSGRPPFAGEKPTLLEVLLGAPVRGNRNG